MVTEEIKRDIQNLDIAQTLAYFVQKYAGAVSFSSSLGQEDQVLTDIIARNNLAVNLFTIDTGRLFAETYELIQATEARYNRRIQVYFPGARQVQKLVNEYGINCFYESVELRKKCCHVRKVVPLQNALKNVKIWVTGLRSAQSENRHGMEKVSWDAGYKVIKYNPLLDWTLTEVTDYLEKYAVPYNPLHNKGFLSIGCAACTRAVLPGEDLRAGRWWWESSKKECGLHEGAVDFQI